MSSVNISKTFISFYKVRRNSCKSQGVDLNPPLTSQSPPDTDSCLLTAKGFPSSASSQGWNLSPPQTNKTMGLDVSNVHPG